MKTFKVSLVFRTREYTVVFITLDETIYGINSKRVNILYLSSSNILTTKDCVLFPMPWIHFRFLKDN